MHETGDGAVLDLIGLLYEAALCPERTVLMLQALKTCVDASICQSYTYDRRSGEVRGSYVSDPLANESATRRSRRARSTHRASAVLRWGFISSCRAPVVPVVTLTRAPD